MNKFKEGNWVREYGEGKPIQLDGGHFRGISSMNEQWFKGLIKWKPKKGEWCWFKDNRGEAQLKRYEKLEPLEKCHVSKQGMMSFTIEPFIGELPTWIDNPQ